MDQKCSKCGSETEVVERQVGVHRGVYCGACGGWLKWLSQPITRARVQAFEMPFGQHKGTRMVDVPISYLAWLKVNCENKKIAEMAGIAETMRLS